MEFKTIGNLTRDELNRVLRLLDTDMTLWSAEDRDFLADFMGDRLSKAKEYPPHEVLLAFKAMRKNWTEKVELLGIEQAKKEFSANQEKTFEAGVNKMYEEMQKLSVDFAQQADFYRTFRNVAELEKNRLIELKNRLEE